MVRGNSRIGRTSHATIVSALTLVVGVLTVVTAHGAGAWQSPESIRDAARTLVRESLANANAAVEAVAVDERLKLPLCEEPLRTDWVRAVQRGQGTVAVSCGGGGAWRLFVPVRVSEQIEIVVARHGIAAGQRIDAADLELKALASTALPHDYLTDPQQAVGLTLRHSLLAGAILPAAALDRPELVARGALVTLVSGTGSVIVKSEGVALEAARLNERIRVRSQSGRIVEGTVQASGEVRVGS